MQSQCFVLRSLFNAFVALLACSVAIAQSGNQSSTPTAKSGTAAAQSQTPTTAPFESQMLAYAALDQVASAIATQVRAKVQEDNSTIIIYDPSSFATIQSYRGFLQGVKILEKAYEGLMSEEEHLSRSTNSKFQQMKPEFRKKIRELNEITDPDLSANLPLSLSTLITQYAGASTVESPANTIIPTSGIAANLANRLKGAFGDKLTVVYPMFMMPESPPDSEDLGNDVEKLMELKRIVGEAIFEREIADATKDAAAIDYKDTNSLLTQFLTNYFTKDPNTGLSGIVTVAQGHTLLSFVRKPNTYVLYAEVIAAGGTLRDRKNLFTNLFSGDLISYSGGAVIAVALVKSTESTLRLADALRYRTPFTRIRKPRNAPATSVGDNLH